MKAFFDFEFTGLTQNTDPISLGVVLENGCSFYAVFNDYSSDKLDDWLIENVIGNLWPVSANTVIMSDRDSVAKSLIEFLNHNSGRSKIEFWGDCSAYDWVLLCELYGGSMNLPKNISYISFDICTMFEMRGVDPDISRVEFTGCDISKQHNALYDANIIKSCYYKLLNYNRDSDSIKESV